MSALSDLLVVQDLDTAVEQLRHRRDALPERGAAKALQAARKALAAQKSAAVSRRDEVAARQASFEKDIAASETRIVTIDKRLYSGEVSAARDLQAMTAEVASIKTRVSTLEDGALAAMDEREPLDAAVVALDATDTEQAAEAERLRAAIAEAEAEIDTALARQRAARAEAAATVDPGLLASYEKLRARLGGVGAARLEHGTCMGCRMKLPATELDRLKREPPEAVVHCDQCGRILVR